MKSRYSKFVSVSCAMLLCSCAALQQQTGGSQQPSAATNNSQSSTATDGRSITKVKVGDLNGEIIGTPAKNSKFAKVRIGMGQREISDLIGQPNDSHTYQTGKAFIPFYFGKDMYRFEQFYKKEGSLTFEGGGITGTSGKLIRIQVDTSATGYAHDE
ncbi:hypothetical protein [Paraburkholderia sp. BCC1884]|uniref:hypothetical protein n=1 Tax=Paraburkholderia sp. BCC1884 TaxID=2562668 RepID=UPI0011828294|nr:hypothetical protein [Paraburkholderia sp. BCC1884]